MKEPLVVSVSQSPRRFTTVLTCIEIQGVRNEETFPGQEEDYVANHKKKIFGSVTRSPEDAEEIEFVCLSSPGIIQ